MNENRDECFSKYLEEIEKLKTEREALVEEIQRISSQKSKLKNDKQEILGAMVEKDISIENLLAEVNKLIKQFEKTRLMMKKMTKNKSMQSKFMQQFGGF